MRLAIISDVHANLEALKATLQMVSTQNVDRIVALGDVVGYNANPAECIALLQQAGALCIGGNHDRAVAGVISTDGFSTKAALAIEWTRRRLNADVLDFLANLPLEANVGNHLVVVHGALFSHGGCERSRLNTEERRRTSFDALMSHPSGARVCAFGNTHQCEIFEWRDGVERRLTGEEVTLRDDAYYLVNPGSVGEPRQRDRRGTYLTFDTGRRTLTLHHVSYDFMRPVAKACDAGLLPFYARFPAAVREPIRWTAETLGLRRYARHMVTAAQRRRRKATTGPGICCGDGRPTVDEDAR